MLNIIIFGAPGAGKGTQAQKLAESLNLKHISTGLLLREEVAKQSEIGKKVEKIIEQGSLVNDKIVDQIIKNKIIENGHKAGFIFDGYPRNLNQAKNLDVFMSQYGLPFILNLEVKTEYLIKRLLLRAKDYNRPDDNEVTIKHRMKIYDEQTKPLLNFYGVKNRVFNINGEASIEDVYKNLLDKSELIIKIDKNK
ncbi:MAG: adenylate kinase [Clostridia bacterium]|nr:adenylate kinase [Clostridia bacterium]